MNNTGNFTAYPNILLEKIILSECTCTEKDIFHLIVRKTYGFNTVAAALSYTYIAKNTGHFRKSIVAAIDRLQNKNMIIKRDGGRGRPNLYSINECWEQWEEYKGSVPQNTTQPEKGSVPQNTKVVSSGTPQVVSYRTPNKEINKKIYKEKGQSPQIVPAYVKNNPFLKFKQHDYDYDVIEDKLTSN